MKTTRILFLFVLICCVSRTFSQVSSDCIDAIPICTNTPYNGGVNGFGIDDFNGGRVNCKGTDAAIGETNSAWYRFRTGASGQLGFNISASIDEDWDFALYQSNDCENLGIPIRCNFFTNMNQNNFIGIGEDPSGDWTNFQYEDWLDVEPGQEYYLYINNFSNSNSGFSIQFTGHIFVTNPDDALDCGIVSQLLGGPVAACENDTVRLDAFTQDASSYTWYRNDGMGNQEILGETSAELAVTESSRYSVRVTIDGEEDIFSEVQVSFSVVPNAYEISNRMVCSVDEIFDLSQIDDEVLGGQDPSLVTVSYHESFIDALEGINFLPREFPISETSMTIFARVTSAENPSCFDAPQEFNLDIIDSPELNFPEEAFLCENLSSVRIGTEISTPGYTYSWNTGQQSSFIDVTQEGTYEITVINTENGFSCPLSKTITVSSTLPVQFSDIEINEFQNNNTVKIIPDTEGDWLYQLDELAPQTSNLFSNVTEGPHLVKLIDSRGCGTLTENILVAGFPKFFSPNGDMINDTWNITGISKLENPVVTIFDRYGKLLAQLDRENPTWDGTYNGLQMPATDYWFQISYTDSSGQSVTAEYINNHFALRR